MKFTLLFIGLMLLKGIELHRHKHGHRHEPTQDDRIKPKPGTMKINWWQSMGQISDTWEK